MADFQVEIKGLDKLLRDAKNGFGVAAGVERGIRVGSVIVEAAAKRNVHKLSRKLQDSTGHVIEGTGWETEGHVGPRPGYGQPRGYSRLVGQGQKFSVAGRTYIDRSRKKRRRVRAVNRSDPQVYGKFEEEGTRYREGHPWLRPALNNNETRIQSAVNKAVREQIEKVGQ